MRELTEIQDKIMKDGSIATNRDLELENNLTKTMHTILKQEETMWAQKAKVNWLQLGDRNTRFFFKGQQQLGKRGMKFVR